MVDRRVALGSKEFNRSKSELRLERKKTRQTKALVAGTSSSSFLLLVVVSPLPLKVLIINYCNFCGPRATSAKASKVSIRLLHPLFFGCWRFWSRNSTINCSADNMTHQHSICKYESNGKWSADDISDTFIINFHGLLSLRVAPPLAAAN